jgi:transcriptional regulator with XRE-family HTH domain
MQNPSNDDKINPINAYIGSRVRMARKRLELNQSYVGYYLKVSYQQIQKFEKGINRLSAEQLAILARILGVSIQYFYQGMPPEYLANPSIDKPDNMPPMPEDIMCKEETHELLNSYYAVEDNHQRLSLLNMLKAFAKRTLVAAETTPQANPLLR